MARPWERLLEQLVRERYGTLVGWATLVCGSRDDAQDLLQEALMATFSSRARFASLPQAEQYVRRAVATRSIDAALGGVTATPHESLTVHPVTRGGTTTEVPER